MKISAVLIRFFSDSVQTLGEILFYENSEKGRLLEAKMLELPDRNNQFEVSRILAKKYKVVKRHSETFKWHFHVLDVEGRTVILIHSGNYYYHTKGCLLPGTSFKDINSDGYLDVRFSRRSLDKMLEIAPDGFFLTILDFDK